MNFKYHKILIALLSALLAYDVGSLIVRGVNLTPKNGELAVTSCPSYSKEDICRAIYIIEGGNNTKYPYGIKSVKCERKEDCKKVCYNTVENNKVRYEQYGYKEYATYLEFLASRYCPIEETNKNDLCRNWLPNLKFYLEK